MTFNLNLSPNDNLYTRLTPWEANSYRLISWWDMEQFKAETFYGVLLVMGNIREQYLLPAKILSDDVMAMGTIAKQLETRIVTQLERTDLINSLVFVQTECQKIALRNSAEAVNEFRSELANWKMEEFSKITAGQIGVRIDELTRNIRREMKLHLFMYIRNERAEYYQSWGEDRRTERGEEIPLFGDMVKTKFPSVDYDINEAGNCFASARDTACVFHLMRILEIGLTVLAKKFGVLADHSNWNPIIDQIESKIKNIRNDPNKPSNWKEEEEFYSQAASHFRIIKDAWRNYTMHVRGKYTEDEAKIIMISVRAFMQKLATKFSE